ncbi:MAG TPA: gliding motility-associated C-terminal domain-containing protein, partial [Crocinitomicaceae bacterium]|nr:gliding motility-associated C-terminal domain-containing protein [Crocinitomicaceae bacterium]
FTPTAGLCASSTTLDITVLAPTAPTFAAIADVCQNATAPVLPTTSTNGVTGTWSPAVSTTTVGTTTYTFTPTAGLCASSTTLDITIINIPVLDPIVDVVNCGNYSLPTITGTNLTGNEAYYNNSQALGGTLITGSITSTQTVWVYDGNGNCSSEISFNVTINAIPGITSMTGGGTYCQGDAVSDIVVNISGNPNWTLDYTLDGVVQQITSGSSPINLGNVPGVYVLTGLTDGNCPSVAAGTQTIVVNPIPSAPVLGPDLDFCATAIIDFMTGTGTAGGTLYWYDDPALNLLDLVGTGQAVYPSNAVGVTTYYVQDDVNGCLSPVSTINVTINDCEVIIPTAFTPDGDFNNDTWEIPGLDDKYPDNIVRIYNRWGNLIYEHASSLTVPYSGNQWDGKYKGKLLPVGSYFFIIDTNNSETKVLKGSISIILNK